MSDPSCLPVPDDTDFAILAEVVVDGWLGIPTHSLGLERDKPDNKFQPTT